MNMIAPGMNVLATVETLTALDVFTGDDAHEKLVTRLEEYVRAQPRDMRTAKGRDEIRSLAAKVTRTKTGLDELGKDYTADLKKQTGAVDAKRKLIRDRLDALRDETRAPLTAFEEAEANRVAEHERLLVLLAGALVFSTVPTLEEIDDRIAKLEPFSARAWEEFAERATEAYDDALNSLNAIRLKAVQAAADAAELAELRRLKAEREEADRATRLLAEQAEKDRINAQRLAAREEEQATARRLAAEQAVKDAEAAAAMAVEDERKRVAAAEAAEKAAAEKRERNRKHRALIHNEICADLIAAGAPNDAELVQAIVKAIATGSIRHVSITY